MQSHVLDHPIWESLATRHSSLAQRHGDVVRYPADVAPFLAVRPGGTCTAEALDALVRRDEGVYLLGEPRRMPPGWELREAGLLAQMVCPRPIAELDGPVIVELHEQQHADVLALAALVYPHYFRPRTTALGRYFGIYREGRLAAMIGERMATDDWQEISAVCTHPDFNGLGYARRLLIWLSNENLARGRTPFLHVSRQNLRAKLLYEQNGYHDRCGIAFWSLVSTNHPG